MDMSEQFSLALREPTGGDQVVPDPYASGMNYKRDMAAAIASKVGVGAEIGRVSSPCMDQMAAAIAEGKHCFVDSGAFNAFKAAMRAGKPGDARLDFGPIFRDPQSGRAGVQRRVNGAQKVVDSRALLAYIICVGRMAPVTGECNEELRI